MKTQVLLSTTVMVAIILILNTCNAFGQLLPDSTTNYYSLTGYYNAYYDSLIQVRGLDSMQGTGYKDYLKWKWFNEYRHSADGSLDDVWQSFTNYHENYVEPQGYIDGSNWQFIGPFGFPLYFNQEPSVGTGKGMMLSIWVDDGDHSLIYAGSHHGGLWKTTDGGINWFPLNDNNPEIHGVNSLAVDPNDHNIVYITGRSQIGSITADHYTAGVFKTIDGGNVFERLEIPGMAYPENFHGSVARKIMIPQAAANLIFYISYRNVFRSNDGGVNWQPVFYKGYFPWPEYTLELYGPHAGLFDLKICPWDANLGFLAGSEMFEISGPLDAFDTVNISEEVFLAGMDHENIESYIVTRTEISLNENYVNKIWFCYVADYIFNSGDTIEGILRVVECDRTNYPNSYSLIYEDAQNLPNAGDKLEFSVSNCSDNIFYIGGISLFKLDVNQTPQFYRIYDGLAKYPEECWLHIDMRDMQIFGNANGQDTLFLANDSGISWGTVFEESNPECDENAWHWRNPCTSIQNGLNITEFYGIGISDKRPYLLGGGCQDVGGMLRDGDDWFNMLFGDGSEFLFDPDDPNIFYYSEMQSHDIWRTNNGGLSGNNIYNGTYCLSIVPMELDPIDASILYSGCETLLRFSGVNDFDNDPTIEELFYFEDKITSIKVVQTDFTKRRYFVSTNKYYSGDNIPDPSEFSGCVFYVDDGEDIIDLSNNLDGCKYGFIADIEVNPFNPDQIWVCAALNSVGQQDVKVFTLTLPGYDWQDYSTGLPNGLPVYKIEYLPPLQQLFALTDIGVFKRNLNESQWHLYSNGLPKKIMIDMDINLNYHKIIGATYGRGLWETEFEDICAISELPRTIAGHEIWTEDELLYGDIEIKNGGVLEISDCVVFMPENAAIIVEQGGKLIIDQSTITSACEKMWSGIEVWGTEGESQYHSQHFGELEIRNGSLIENARTAIANYPRRSGIREDRGGIIQALQSTFRNNQISVDLDIFRNHYPQPPYNEAPYFSKFILCEF